MINRLLASYDTTPEEDEKRLKEKKCSKKRKECYHRTIRRKENIEKIILYC